jgi:hypothetical protein
MFSNKREREVWLRIQFRSSYNDTLNGSQVGYKALDVAKDGWVPQKINMLSKYVQYDSKVLNGVVFDDVQDEFQKQFLLLFSSQDIIAKSFGHVPDSLLYP